MSFIGFHHAKTTGTMGTLSLFRYFGKKEEIKQKAKVNNTYNEDIRESMVIKQIYKKDPRTGNVDWLNVGNN